ICKRRRTSPSRVTTVRCAVAADQSGPAQAGQGRVWGGRGRGRAAGGRGLRRGLGVAPRSGGRSRGNDLSAPPPRDFAARVFFGSNPPDAFPNADCWQGVVAAGGWK